LKFSNKIQPTEIKSQAWNKKEKDTISPNVCALSEKFNKTSYWAATEVIMKGDNRPKVLERLIQLAMYLRELKNYNSLLGIIAGLNLACITRLKDSWKEVGSKYLNIFEELSELCNPISNYKNYREAMRVAQGPCLPYLGLFLHDLTFIEDGNPDYLDENNTAINFEKMRMIAGVFLNIQKYQQQQYNFKEISTIREYLNNTLVIHTEEELYKLSLTMAPNKK